MIYVKVKMAGNIAIGQSLVCLPLYIFLSSSHAKSGMVSTWEPKTVGPDGGLVVVFCGGASCGRVGIDSDWPPVN